MTDAFDTLGLEPSFTLSREELDARQRALSSALHPDRYAGAMPAERRRALNEAIAVNEAHRALKDPLRRAEVLLARLGLEEPKTQPAHGFLFEIMELREGLSAAARAKDLTEVRRLAVDIDLRGRTAEARLGELFAAWLSPTNAPAAPAESAATELFSQLAELRYYRRFLDEVAGIEDELDG